MIINPTGKKLISVSTDFLGRKLTLEVGKVGFRSTSSVIVKYGEENPKFPLITDGHLQNNILTIIGKNKEWLQEELKKQGYQSIHEVYLGEYNKGELKLFPYKK